MEEGPTAAAAPSLTLRLCTWNVHSFSFFSPSASTPTRDIPGKVHAALTDGAVDVALLQEVTEDTIRTRFPSARFCPAPGYLGNALVLGRGAVVDHWACHTIDSDRSMLSARVVWADHALHVYCTHLDHQSEARRLRQLDAVLRVVDADRAALYGGNSFPHVLGGDLNALARADYDDARWRALEAHRAERYWEAPESQVTAKLAQEGYVDLGAAQPVMSSRFATRIDYIWAKHLPVTWKHEALGSLQEPGLSDHRSVLVALTLQ